MHQMYRAGKAERKIKLYVANIALDLLGHDLLQQENTQISIPQIFETKHKLTFVSGKKY